MALDIGTLDKLLALHTKLLGYPAYAALRAEVNMQIDCMEAEAKKDAEAKVSAAKPPAPPPPAPVVVPPNFLKESSHV